MVEIFDFPTFPTNFSKIRYVREVGERPNFHGLNIQDCNSKYNTLVEKEHTSNFKHRNMNKKRGRDSIFSLKIEIQTVILCNTLIRLLDFVDGKYYMLKFEGLCC